MKDRRRSVADHFLRSVSQHLLGTSIEDRDQSLRISGNDRDLGCRIEHRLQPFFRSSEFRRAFQHPPFQFVAGALLVIYIGGGAHPLDDLAGLIRNGKARPRCQR